jgi:superfamily II DNA or RNA helicase
MKLGLYEELISKMINARLEALDKEKFYIKKTALDKAETARFLALYLMDVVRKALDSFGGEDVIEKQIRLTNNLIRFIRDELKDDDFEEDLVSTEANILSAIFSKEDTSFSNLDLHLKEITPSTRLRQSELFTGNNGGLSLQAELKKEILSADQIYFLVSFIKWSGIVIFQEELKNFTDQGKQLKIITTSYMGATDPEAIEFLSGLKNTEIKISYDTKVERLHAKSYLFMRGTGFHTGYIGSSNISHSALNSGLEWNIKVTTKEIPHILEKSLGTFKTYWEKTEFETYDIHKHKEKFRQALRSEKYSGTKSQTYFTITPHPYQQEILDNLEAERVVHKRFRNLIVAATGTGKTVISAFDYKRFANSGKTKLLYVAHRKEILEQALDTFQGILKDNNFGELWVDGNVPEKFDHVFASVQTLNNELKSNSFSANFYDFIIIDEVHHIAAKSYRPILQHFSPTILLGLTATPERMDNEDILKDFCDIIAVEIRLPEALNSQLLCPFQYFGVSDSVDLKLVPWIKGRYQPSELTKVYTQNDRRVSEIIQNLHKYIRDPHQVTALGFCVTQEHARYMAEKFILAGFKSDFLVSSSSSDRTKIRTNLIDKSINYLFVVDIFNEGVDIPEIDLILFLRPTESLTIFLQQLGRGLRNADGKEYVTILDFIGQANSEYDFESKFRSLVGKTNQSLGKEVENGFPHLPLGCSIILERKAKEHILTNIKKALGLNKNQIVQKIRNYKHQTALPLTLKNFLQFYHISLQALYGKETSWKRLCVLAEVIDDFPSIHETEIKRAIRLKWLNGNSYSYYSFILTLAYQNFEVDVDNITEEEHIMCLMLHYDVWQVAGGFDNLQASIRAIGTNPVLVEEVIEVLEMITDRIDFVEKKINLGYIMPLQLHSRYSKDQIFAAFGFSTFASRSSIREGVALRPALNAELLFITLKKSTENFSPTTLYDDFAISDTLFNWQSQNAARPDRGKGLSYIEHGKSGKKILLFVREQSEDEYGNTLGFVFLGEADYVEHSGSKPMSITWRLRDKMPAYIWKESGKLAVG